MALRRHLRLMGHAQHLSGFAQRAEFLADDLGDCAADAGIDFIEDHRRHRVQTQRRHFDRQRYPRQFAAGGDFAQRSRRLPGVGRYQKFDPLRTQRVGTFGVVRFQRDLETAAAHAQFGDQRGGRLRQRRCGHAARGAERYCGLAPADRCAEDLVVQTDQAGTGIAQRFKLGRQAVADFGQRLWRDPVLAAEVV